MLVDIIAELVGTEYVDGKENNDEFTLVVLIIVIGETVYELVKLIKVVDELLYDSVEFMIFETELKFKLVKVRVVFLANEEVLVWELAG